MRARVAFSLLLLSVLTVVSGQTKHLRLFAEPQIVTVDETALKHMVAGFKGHVVVLNFWATWCIPCREEFPDLLRLRRTYREKGLELLFVSIDNSKKSLPQVGTFLRQEKVDFPTYIKHTTNDEAFINSINKDWSGALPATFIYDREGRLIHSRIDAQSFEQLSRLVVPLLGE